MNIELKLCHRRYQLQEHDRSYEEQRSAAI